MSCVKLRELCYFLLVSVILQLLHCSTSGGYERVVVHDSVQSSTFFVAKIVIFWQFVAKIVPFVLPFCNSAQSSRAAGQMMLQGPTVIQGIAKPFRL